MLLSPFDITLETLQLAQIQALAELIFKCPARSNF